MFGGLAFLHRGNMCCGIVGSDLMVRVGAEEYERVVTARHARPMDFTGRPAKGMVYVAPEGLRTEKALRHWIDRGVRFTASLPPKKALRR
jgi:TfoX/Sxy family transcriptional regulator of competence genes